MGEEIVMPYPDCRQLHAFYRNACSELDKFVGWYKRQHRTRPKEFPLDLNEDQWWEQYHAWDQAGQPED